MFLIQPATFSFQDFEDDISPVSPVITQIRREPSGVPYQVSVLEGDRGNYQVIHRARVQRTQSVEMVFDDGEV